MTWFSKLICCSDSKPVAAAGCFFTNGSHLLAGYQPTKKKPIISGIGGKVEDGETWYQTTIRELFEELLEIKILPDGFISEIRETITFSHAFLSKKYTFTLYTFNDLENILKLALRHSLQSPLYPDGLPLTISDLIFKRSHLAAKEVKQLVLLPLTDSMNIDKDLLQDVKDYLKYYPL